MKATEQSYFDNHPDTDIFYFTSDGYAFFNENDAISHAQMLDDDMVRLVERSETSDDTEY
jgi:hypothetical protein